MLAPCITMTTPMEALFDHSGGDLRLGMRRSFDGDGDDKKRRLGAVGCSSNSRQTPLDARKQRGRWAMGRSRGLSSGKLFHFFLS